MPAPPMTRELMIETLKIYESAGRNLADAARSASIPYTTFQSRFYKASQAFPDGIPHNYAPISGKWTYERLVGISEPSTRWIIGSDLHIWSVHMETEGIDCGLVIIISGMPVNLISKTQPR